MDFQYMYGIKHTYFVQWCRHLCSITGSENWQIKIFFEGCNISLLEDVMGTLCLLFEGISCNCDCNFVGKLKCFTAKIIATSKWKIRTSASDLHKIIIIIMKVETVLKEKKLICDINTSWWELIQVKWNTVELRSLELEAEGTVKICSSYR